MSVSQKCQYAVRALLELSKRHGKGPVRSGEIAARQGIPPRFLENILNEMKTSGLVESRRGAQGGFLLACRPEQLTVGRVIRLIDGPLDPVRCTKEGSKVDCRLRDCCSLLELWQQAKTALEAVYDRATFADLAKKELALESRMASEYSI